MIAIIDYGMGNLRSVQKALEFLDYEAIITSDSQVVRTADKVILPGVGAFADAILALKACDGMVDALNDTVNTGKPLLGICLGMQLLMERSYEMGQWDGLGFIKGDVLQFPTNMGYKVPQIGWNNLTKMNSPILKGLPENPYVYFVHSYYCKPTDNKAVGAHTDYIVDFCAVISQENIYATQFHPEKSGDIGLKILDNFGKL